MSAAHVVADEGLAGDMLLGALVDAGVALDELAGPVAALGAGLELTARTVEVRGVAATKVDVVVPEEAPRAPTLADARALLEAAGLAPAVGGPAGRVLATMAEAEAAAHGTTADRVVLHELGDLDTVADVVGVCAGLAALGVARLTCGPVAVGAGEAATDHGVLTVPPPAVTTLLRGFVIRGGADDGPRRELTTPTGAALVATLAEPVAGVPLLRLGATGHGSGDPQREAPSLVTLLVGDAAGEAGGAPGGAPARPAAVLEATVDDLPGEHVPVVLDRLRDGGAHDAWAVPAIMKKGRPGHTLTALADEADVPALAGTLMREAGTLGVRWHRVVKHPLARRWVDVDVDGHGVRVKVGELGGEAVVVAPEHDDVAAAAAALGRPLRDVAADASAQGRRRLAAGA